MIRGIGTDIVEISRVQNALKSDTFFQKTFTESEREHIDSRKTPKGRAEAAAGIFAAKEAFAKAYGTGFRGFRPGDVEIVYDELGKPSVNYKGIIAHASISHDESCAIAFVIIEEGES